MKRIHCILWAMLLMVSLYIPALGETMSLADMQKHTSYDLSALEKYTAFFDDRTYSAVFYNKEYKIYYGTFRDSQNTEYNGYLYLGFDVITLNGEILIRPAMIRWHHTNADWNSAVSIYIKADDNRYLFTNKPAGSADKFQYTRIFNTTYTNAADMTLLIDPTTYEMLVSMSTAAQVTIDGNRCSAATISAIRSYLDDIRSMKIPLPEENTGWCICYTNWNGK